MGRVVRHLGESLAHEGAHRGVARATLAFLALVILVIPALDLAWNEWKAAEHHGVRCPLHANPVMAACPVVFDPGQIVVPGPVLGESHPPQLLALSIFIRPKL